jgi:ribosomal protein L32
MKHADTNAHVNREQTKNNPTHYTLTVHTSGIEHKKTEEKKQSHHLCPSYKMKSSLLLHSNIPYRLL